MAETSFKIRRQFQQLDRELLRDHQLQQLNQLGAEILPGNRFYAGKLPSSSFPLESLDALAQFPFTCKEELASDTAAGMAVNRFFAA